jgi:hypothetical protein
MMAEYQTLRTESLNSIGHRLTVVSFTLAALSVLLAGLMSADVSVFVAGVLAYLFVPQLAKAALLIWMGEYKRSERAGDSIAALEARINQRLDFDALSWEQALRRNQGAHMTYPYVATIVFTLGAGYAGIVLGVYLIVDGLAATSVGWAWTAAVLLVMLALVVEPTFLHYLYERWKEARGNQSSTAC